MAFARKRGPRFLDINTLIRERDRMKNLRYKVKCIAQHNLLNQKRGPENTHTIENKVFHFTFEDALLEKPKDQPEYKPNAKRRRTQNEVFQVAETNYFEGHEMDVEALPTHPETPLPSPFEVQAVAVRPETLLQSGLEVVSPVPPEDILEPSTSEAAPTYFETLLPPGVENNYQRSADTETSSSWLVSIHNIASSKLRLHELDVSRRFEGVPQNASSENFEPFRYRTCFKKRSILRVKDGADDIDQKEFSHPGVALTTIMKNRQNNDILEPWNILKEHFSQP